MKTSQQSGLMAIAILTMCGCQQTVPLGSPVAHRAQQHQMQGSVAPTPNGQSKLLAARAMEKQGQHKQAAQLYHEVKDINPNDATPWHRLAVLHDKNGERQIAAQYYDEALKRDPNNAELLSDYGYSCILAGESHAAHDHLLRALELQPDLRRAQNNLGVLYAQFNRHDEALNAFLKGGCSEAEAKANLTYAVAAHGKRRHVAKPTEVAMRPSAKTTPTAKDDSTQDSVEKIAEPTEEITLPRRVGKAPIAKGNSEESTSNTAGDGANEAAASPGIPTEAEWSPERG